MPHTDNSIQSLRRLFLSCTLIAFLLLSGCGGGGGGGGNSSASSPVITSTAVTDAVEDQPYSYDVDATDPNAGDVLSYSLTNSPAGMTINATTGLITWTPANNDVGLHSVTVRVDDGNGEFDTQTFNLVVVNVNDPPVFVSTPVTGALQAQLYSYDANATDPDAGDVLSYSLQTAPAGMIINTTTGLVTWTPASSDIGPHPVSIRAGDNNGAFNLQSYNLVVANVNDPPVFVSTPVTSAIEDQPYSYDANAVDQDNDPLTYSLDAASLSRGMTINASSGVINWIPVNAYVGSNPVTVRVQDTFAQFDLQTFNIIVSNVNDAPVIVSPAVTSVVEHQLYNYDVDATDPDTGDVLSYSLQTAPAGMVINANTGLVTWTPDSSDVGLHPVTVRVDDNHGLFATQAFNVSVININDAPIVQAIPLSKVGKNHAFTLQVYASDSDTGDTLGYSLDVNSQSRGMIIDTNGMISWTPSSAQVGSYTVTVTVTDSGTPALATNVNFTLIVLNTLSQSGWTLQYVDSQETSGEDGAATNAFDGNTTTIWHTQYTGGEPPPPHEIIINLQTNRNIDGFRYLPRQDGDFNGRINKYEFYVTSSLQNWGAPIATGTFANTPFEKEVVFPQVTGQYIRLIALNEVIGGPFTSAAEINVLGGNFPGNFAPNGVINTPANNITITAGNSAGFTSTGTDPDSNLPLTYLWNFGDPAIADSTVEDPGLVTFNTPGTYVVSLTVTDAFGLADTTPATRVIKVLAPGEDPRISKAGWSLHYVDSQAVGLATNAFDNNQNTIWFTQSSPSTPVLPHEIQIDLGSAYAIDGFRYLPRQDGSSNGRISNYEVYVSADGLEWGNPVASGIFGNSPAEKQLLFAPKFGQFVRLVALSEVNGNQWTSAAEINVEGQCETPYVRILQPRNYALQPLDDLAVTTSVCLNPVTHAGWGVKFTIDGGSSVIDDTPPYETTFFGQSMSEHIVRAVIVNDAGVEIAGAMAQHQVSPVGIGDYYVAIGDSITVGAFDNISVDNISLDGRNIEGGFTPVLNNLLTNAKNYPQTVVMEGVSGHTAADGLARLPSVLARHPDSQYYLILYGTNDAGGLTPVDPTTFKNTLQQMINLIIAAGKQAYLSRIPYTGSPSRNIVIQTYNTRIDQLVTENSIPVSPPDFYSHFQTFPSQLGDILHPNGIGYQSMAQLWFGVLP